MESSEQAAGSGSGATTAAGVVGTPVLPPGPLSAAVGRARAGARRAIDAVGPPPVRILEGLFGLLDHRVLVALCEADVPDQLAGPTALVDLADRTGTDPVRLERLVRYATVRGWVRIDRRGRVRPTSVTRFLRQDHPGGWRAWVRFAGGTEIAAAVANLSARVDDGDAFAEANGAPFFGWMADHPDRWEVFDDAMAAGGRLHALGLAAALDWRGTRSICDVGGGTGHLLATLLHLLPETDGTVLDLAEVVARAVRHPRLVAMAGDAFESVPAGHDTYLLVNVLHDWSDDDAEGLLASVARAADGARIVVVEADRPTVPSDVISTGADVLMAALTGGGRERSAREFAALGRGAGVGLVASTRLASGDWAHELR